MVVDTDPAGAYASPPTGNIDNEDAFAPLGTVVWFDENNTPIANASGGNATCNLSIGNALGAPYLTQQLFGLPDYASSCNVTMKLIGHHNLTAQYNGEPGPPTNPHGHRPVQSKQIDSDFN